MTGIELVSMLGEAATIKIARNKNTKGFDENKTAAKEGGDVADKARKDLEKRTGKKVITKQNYLNTTQKLENDRELLE